jgi:hypothetical protein
LISPGLLSSSMASGGAPLITLCEYGGVRPVTEITRAYVAFFRQLGNEVVAMLDAGTVVAVAATVACASQNGIHRSEQVFHV